MRNRRGLEAPVPEAGDQGKPASASRAAAVPASVPDRVEGGLTLVVGARQWALHGTRLLVGRSGGEVGADVEIDEPSLSRRHAELVVSGTTWTLRDLGSTNGTWVGDRRLTAGEVVELAPGAAIRLGSVVATIRSG
jgi:hypothetical protein